MDDRASQDNLSDTPPADNNQNEIDEALNKLPETLEKPVEKAPDTQEPEIKPSPSMSSPPLAKPVEEVKSEPKPEVKPELPPLLPIEKKEPEVESIPEVKPEQPENIEPMKKKSGKKVIKAVGGALVLALLVGGGLYGNKLVQEKQEVESMAVGPSGSWQPGDVEISSSGKTMYVAVVDKNTGEKKVKTINTRGTEIDKAMDDGRDGRDRVNFNLQGVIDINSGVGGTREAVQANNALNTDENQQLFITLKDNLDPLSESGTERHLGKPLNTSIESGNTVELWIGKNITDDDPSNPKINAKDGAKYFQVSYAEALALIAVYGSGQIDQGSDSWATFIDGDCTGPLCDQEEDPDPPSSPPPGGPKTCSQSCTSTSECTSGLGCIDGGSGKMCLNLLCTEETDCVCPTVSYSCSGLAGGSGVSYGDTETFTCTAAFSAVNPVAFFRHKVDTGAYTTSDAVALTGTTATYDITVDQYGSWEVQCRICTDSNATNCTTWGNAN